jgi:glycosyltransferase involved in cell wall biosynthesis
MARELLRRGGLFSPEVCGYGARQLLAAARRERADLTIIHAESGLWIGTRLVRDGLGVGVDFEDWFSEDIGEGDPLAGRARALKGFEAKLLQTCRYRLATSHAMARALAAEHAVTPPMVIYNSFPRLECSRFNSAPRDRHDLSLPSLTWFSQTIGEFRGLEDLFAALPLLKQKCEIHLRGSIRPETRERFLGLCPAEWRVHLFFHPTVASEELPARIAEHDIGLALERRRPRSRNLTITNKLFQYMQAGLAIVATSTEGQVEAMSRAPGAGLLTEEGPKGLADGLNQRLTDKIALHRAKELSKQAFEREFAWELHEPDLRNHLEEGLKPA